MLDNFTQLFVHLVWGTWDRLPLLTEKLREQVYYCLILECEKLGAKVIALNGMPDHVHLLVQIPTGLSVGALVKQIKGSSSHLAAHQLQEGFKWQGGYGAFTVSKSDVARIKDYVLNQERHHAEQWLEEDLELSK